MIISIEHSQPKYLKYCSGRFLSADFLAAFPRGKVFIPPTLGPPEPWAPENWKTRQQTCQQACGKEGIHSRNGSVGGRQFDMRRMSAESKTEASREPTEGATRARKPGPEAGTKRTPAQLRRTAYHEAGHAVAAIHFGYPFERVWLNPTAEDEDTPAGKLLGAPSRYDPLTEENRLWGEQEISIHLAGPVANAMFIGRVDRKRGGTDFTWAFFLCRQRFPDESWNEIHALLNAFLACTISLLSDARVWSAVGAIAEILVSNHEISFDEVQMIVERQTGQPRSKCHRERSDFETERARSRQFLRDSIQLVMDLRQGSSE